MMLSPTENTCWRSGAGEEKMEKMEMEMEKIEKMEKMPIWSRLKYLSNGVED